MSPLLHFLFILFAVAAVVNTSATTDPSDGSDEDFGLDTLSRRFLPEQSRVLATATCDKYPQLCRVKSSPGPDCCRKACTNIKTDRLNCGMCGHKCRVYEICCKGYCVNPMFDKRNCNGCNIKCKKGGYCIYGMCDYA
ncbi:stigma-specific STIG1-like protein 2 [Syzygium oleosum]|uniref:stigma-specific STIG1-like protein 2 n=1 Tax=Syzygium oleosum TaxID=219896 RepID=UPI0024BACB6C|nr:stigma-specific STIG1-like protein 2 [Syzygium oleosum]